MSASLGAVEFLNLDNVSHKTTQAYVVHYRYNTQLVSILISTAPPEGCEREDAIELPWIDRLWDLSSHDGQEQARLSKQVHDQAEIAREIRDVVFPTLKRLAPSPTFAAPSDSARPARHTTVAKFLFPHRIRLELVTKNGKLEVLLGHHEELDWVGLAAPWSALGELGLDLGSVPTFAAEDVSLGSRVVMDMDVFDVSVPEMSEDVVGKFECAVDPFQRSFKREIGIYGKLRNLSLDAETRVPELKGEIQVPFRQATLPSMLSANTDTRLAT